MTLSLPIPVIISILMTRILISTKLSPKRVHLTGQCSTLTWQRKKPRCHLRGRIQTRILTLGGLNPPRTHLRQGVSLSIPRITRAKKLHSQSTIDTMGRSVLMHRHSYPNTNIPILSLQTISKPVRISNNKPSAAPAIFHGEALVQWHRAPLCLWELCLRDTKQKILQLACHTE